MRAAQIDRYGGPEVLVVRDDVEPDPVGPRDVLVEVHASSVNPVDTKIRAGALRGAVRYKLPWTLGLDVSGVVVETGANVTRLAVGDEVYCSPGHTRPGCYAELVTLDEAAVAKKPSTASHLEAASLPLVGLTAMRCLEPRLSRAGGRRVFIQAGAGGVGSFAIQLAKIFDAHVITTASPRNEAFVRELGADEVIDYRETDFADVVTNCDLVLESIGPPVWARAMRIVKRGGELTSITSGMPDHTARFGPNLALVVTGLKMASSIAAGLVRGIKVRHVVRGPDADGLARLAGWVDDGKLRAIVDQVFPLDEIAAAHAALEKGGGRGKIVVQVR